MGVTTTGLKPVAPDPAAPRVAIAHDYLTQRGGAERVVLALTRAFPGSVVHTTLFDPAGTFPEFSGVDVRATALNRLAVFRRNHRRALLVLPFVASRIRIDADVVIASSSGWAHGFRTPGTKVVYCYSPARWLYQADRYLGDSGGTLQRAVLAVAGPMLRAWDRRAAKSAQRYLAISTEVKGRIHRAYGQDSTVVPAPHSMDANGPQESLVELGVPENAEDFYLCPSRLLPYKHVDKIIAAVAREPKRSLIVVGSGPEERRLARDLPSNVTMVKNLTDGQLRWLYARSRAIVSASHEDFGLTPLEGAVFGKPAVLLRWGGFLDTTVEGVTGEFFDEPTAESISEAFDRFESKSWDAVAISEHAARYSEESFAAAMRAIVAAATAASSRSEPPAR